MCMHGELFLRIENILLQANENRLEYAEDRINKGLALRQGQTLKTLENVIELTNGELTRLHRFEIME